MGAARRSHRRWSYLPRPGAGNGYIALAVIVILGLASIGFARHEYQSSAASASATVQPAVGTTWYAGMASNVCGTPNPTSRPAPPPTRRESPRRAAVAQDRPQDPAEAGKNATLGQFVNGYDGLHLTQEELQLPGQKAYTNGEKCPTGTPDAGKTGEVIVADWPTPPWRVRAPW